MGKSIAEILAENGIDPSEASKAIRKLNADNREARIELLSKEKEGNRDKVVGLAESIRETLEQEGANLLSGSHLNFTVRVTDKGVIATANECHATGYVESIHVCADGAVETGKDGAEKAKNVRPRKKSE